MKNNTSFSFKAVVYMLLVIVIFASLAAGCSGTKDSAFQDKYDALLDKDKDDDNDNKEPDTTQPITKPLPTPSPAKQFEGLWQTDEATVDGQTEDVLYLGMAFQLAADGSATKYEGYAESGTGMWQLMEDDTLQLTGMQGNVVTLHDIEMGADGTSFTADTTSNDGVSGSLRFVKKDLDSFLAAAGPALSAKLQGFWWQCGSDDLPPLNEDALREGVAIVFSGMNMEVYLGFEQDSQQLYEVVDGTTIQYTEGGDENTLTVGFETIDDTTCLVIVEDGSSYYFLPSSYEHFMSAQEPAAPDNNIVSFDAASWGSEEQFQQAVTSGAWQYAGTVDITREMNVPEYADITPTAGQVLQFDSNGTLSVIYMEGTDDDGEIGYDFGVKHACVVVGEYNMPDELYEVNYHYYIDVQGRLIETVRLYSFDRDEYYIVSNANIFVPYEP